MKDLGEKSMGGALVAKPPEKWYPSTTVDAEDFPGLVEYKMGKDWVVTMKVRKTGERISKGTDGKTSHKIDLELRGMETEKMKPKGLADAGHMVEKEEKEK